MTPELMERILQELREGGFLPEKAEPAAIDYLRQPGQIRPGQVDDPLSQGMAHVSGDFLPEQLLQAEPNQFVDTHPWFDQGQMTQEMLEMATRYVMEQQNSTEPAPSEAMAEEFMSMHDGHDEPILQGLEAVVQEAMPQPEPFQMQEDPYEEQRLLYEEQMQQMLNPFMMPGFGPGL
jgi:hypothetical protein